MFLYLKQRIENRLNALKMKDENKMNDHLFRDIESEE
jgi:hypothetical protein